MSLKARHLLEIRILLESSRISSWHNLKLFIQICYLLQGIRIIQSNTSFLLLQYTYMQGYMFRLRGAIIRPLP